MIAEDRHTSTVDGAAAHAAQFAAIDYPPDRAELADASEESPDRALFEKRQAWRRANNMSPLPDPDRSPDGGLGTPDPWANYSDADRAFELSYLYGIDTTTNEGTPTS